MRSYELMWILSGDSTDSDGLASIDKFKALVASRGGEVKQAELWGRRTMAFPVKGRREGAYYVARFSVDGALAPEIEHAVNADQSILRHLMVLADELPEQPEQSATQTQSGTETVAPAPVR